MIRRAGPLLALALAGCASAPTPPPTPPTQTLSTAPPQVNRLQPPTMVCPAKGPTAHHCGAAVRGWIPQARPELAEPAPVLAADDDLWERLRRGHRLDPCGQGPRVAEAGQIYLRSSRFFGESMQRILPLLDFVASEVERRGLPSELVWLPMVESSYVALPAQRHLAGMWQIARITSSDLDLRRDAEYDGRIDPVSSTRAALDLLQHLHFQLDGDWRLAILAYNAGEFAVKNALARHAASGNPEPLEKLRLRPHTYEHLYRLLALACIMEQPERHGVELPPGSGFERLRIVPLAQPLDLRLAARLSGLDDAALTALNAGFLQPWTPARGPHRLLLPEGAARRLERELRSLDPALWTGWAWQPIQRATPVAMFARDVDATLLARVNGVEVDELLPAGRPALVRRASAVVPSSAVQAQPASSLAASAPSEAGPAEHRVSSGDTLWSLARRYRVSVEQLRAWNGLDERTPIRVGQRLKLRPPSASPAARAAASGQLDDGREVPEYYVVKPSDSLWLIARRHGLRAHDLIQWNGLGQNTELEVGQQLRLRPPPSGSVPQGAGMPPAGARP